MGAAAENIPATPQPAAPSAPSAPGGGGDAGGSSQQGSPTPKGPEGAPAAAGGADGTSAQPADKSPAGTAEGQGIPGKPVADPHVPWRKFREVQTELTNVRRSHAGELERVQGQIAAVTRERDELRQTKTDYDIL